MLKIFDQITDRLAMPYASSSYRLGVSYCGCQKSAKQLEPAYFSPDLQPHHICSNACWRNFRCHCFTYVWLYIHGRRYRKLRTLERRLGLSIQQPLGNWIGLCRPHSTDLTNQAVDVDFRRWQIDGLYHTEKFVISEPILHLVSVKPNTTSLQVNLIQTLYLR